MRAVYRAEPSVMAAQAMAMKAAGATIVGACCGSTPDHLRAMTAALTGRA
jgi:methionine synthase I (cobalamin-dependent)